MLGKFKDDFIKKFLSINGFTKQYPDRVISSIYLDTKNLILDNINGVSDKRKLDLDGIITMRQQFFMRFFKKIKKFSGLEKYQRN